MMIEELLIEYLESSTGFNVYAEIPEQEEDRYIVIERVGRKVVNQLTTDSIAIQSYAPSMAGACALDAMVQKEMFAMTNSNVSGVHLSSSYNFTDTARKKYRFQSVFEISHYL